MRLYYTGAPKHLSFQGSPLISLGGNISSTLVPSGVRGSLLPDISQNDLSTQTTYSLLVALKNTLGQDATDIKVYFELPDSSLYNLEIGLVQPAIVNSIPIFEQITSPKSIPIGISFSNANSLTNAISVSSLSNNSYLGIWIKRTLADNAKETFLGCDSLNAAFLDSESVLAKTSFEFDLKIDYTS